MTEVATFVTPPFCIGEDRNVQIQISCSINVLRHGKIMTPTGSGRDDGNVSKTITTSVVKKGSVCEPCVPRGQLESDHYTEPKSRLEDILDPARPSGHRFVSRRTIKYRTLADSARILPRRMRIPALRSLSEPSQIATQAANEKSKDGQNDSEEQLLSETSYAATPGDIVISPNKTGGSSGESWDFGNPFAVLERRTNMDRPMSEIDTLAETSSVYQINGMNERGAQFTLFDTVRRSFRTDHEERTKATLRRSKTTSSETVDALFAACSPRSRSLATADSTRDFWQRLGLLEQQNVESSPVQKLAEVSGVVKKIDRMSFATFEDERDIREMRKQMLAFELRQMEKTMLGGEVNRWNGSDEVGRFTNPSVGESEFE